MGPEVIRAPTTAPGRATAITPSTLTVPSTSTARRTAGCTNVLIGAFRFTRDYNCNEINPVSTGAARRAQVHGEDPEASGAHKSTKEDPKAFE